jgi:NTE family protein
MLIAQTEKRGVYMNDNLGIVFSGGGALGLAHIGAIKALEEYDLEPCYVAGSSMGAIIGVMYAAGYTSDEIMKIVEDRRLYKVGHLMSWQSAYWNQGMSTQKTLYKELREFVPHNSFDSLERRFMVCVTNVETGEPVYRHTGDNLKEFVAASASIPGESTSIPARPKPGGRADELGGLPMDLEHERRLTEVEERSKSNSHRLDKLEESTEAINRLATSMEVMAERQEQVVETVGKLDTKVTALEEKPAKRWDSLVDKIVWAIAAALIGFVLAQLGL